MLPQRATPIRRVRRGDARLLDDERDHPAERRIEEPVPEADDVREHDEQLERQVTARIHGGQRGDGDEPGEIRDDHQPPPREPVGERAADQERGEDADALADEDDAELRGSASVKVFQPSAVRNAASPISEIVCPVKR